MENCTKIQAKVNKMKGQISGIDKMINEGRSIEDIITQITAVRSALSGLAVDLLKEESQTCFEKKSDSDKLKSFEKIVTRFFKIT
jgi:DNA-binding FrmR family transcriptional regulator